MFHPSRLCPPGALAESPLPLASQERLYEQLRTRALTLVWGPPGSGKTYFLTAAICRLLISAYSAAGAVATNTSVRICTMWA